MSKKKLIFVISGIALLGLAGYFFFGRNESIKNYPPKNQTIVAFGDSLIQGVGASPGNDFVSIVSRNLGKNIINKGVSGDTTISAKKRIQEITNLNPGIVLVLLGGNDELQRLPKESTFQNLGNIIEELQNSGALVVLLGVRGGILYDTREADYKALSIKYRTVYISNVLNNLITDKKYMSDGIHPNDLGYAIIAERVTDALEKVLK